MSVGSCLEPLSPREDANILSIFSFDSGDNMLYAFATILKVGLLIGVLGHCACDVEGVPCVCTTVDDEVVFDVVDPAIMPAGPV
jgi:hypothetical protein